MRFKNRAWGPGASPSNASRAPGSRASRATTCECGPFFAGGASPARSLFTFLGGAPGVTPRNFRSASGSIDAAESQNGRATGKNVSGGNGVALAVETLLTKADLQAFGAPLVPSSSKDEPPRWLAVRQAHHGRVADAVSHEERRRKLFFATSRKNAGGAARWRNGMISGGRRLRARCGTIRACAAGLLRRERSACSRAASWLS